MLQRDRATSALARPHRKPLEIFPNHGINVMVSVLVDQSDGYAELDVSSTKAPGQEVLSGVYFQSAYFVSVASHLYDVPTAGSIPLTLLNKVLRKVAPASLEAFIAAQD